MADLKSLGQKATQLFQPKRTNTRSPQLAGETPEFLKSVADFKRCQMELQLIEQHALGLRDLQIRTAQAHRDFIAQLQAEPQGAEEGKGAVVPAGEPAPQRRIQTNLTKYLEQGAVQLEERIRTFEQPTLDQLKKLLYSGCTECDSVLKNVQAYADEHQKLSSTLDQVRKTHPPDAPEVLAAHALSMSATQRYEAAKQQFLAVSRVVIARKEVMLMGPIGEFRATPVPSYGGAPSAADSALTRDLDEGAVAEASNVPLVASLAVGAVGVASYFFMTKKGGNVKLPWGN